MRFTNKTVFITGAAGGIGRQTGLSFAKEGANVAVSDLDFDMAERVANEIKSAGGIAEPFKLDVTNQEETIEAMKNAFGHFGSLDVAFCNAGRSQESMNGSGAPKLKSGNVGLKQFCIYSYYW